MTSQKGQGSQALGLGLDFVSSRNPNRLWGTGSDICRIPKLEKPDFYKSPNEQIKCQMTQIDHFNSLSISEKKGSPD